MDPIERRAFLKRSAAGLFAFKVGGAEVLLSAREAHAQNVPFRLLKAGEAETIETLGETLVPGARAAGIAHFESIINFLSRRKKPCWRRGSSMSARPMPTSIALRSAPSTTRAKRSTAAANSRSSLRANSTTSSTLCARTRSQAGKDPVDPPST